MTEYKTLIIADAYKGRSYQQKIDCQLEPL